MPDAKENINSPTRLPDELKDLLRKEQAKYLARGKSAPSYGTLLMEAWRAYKPIEGTRGLPPNALAAGTKSKKVLTISQTDVGQRCYNSLSFILESGSEREQHLLAELLAENAKEIERRRSASPEIATGTGGRATSESKDLGSGPPKDDGPKSQSKPRKR